MKISWKKVIEKKSLVYNCILVVWGLKFLSKNKITLNY